MLYLIILVKLLQDGSQTNRTCVPWTVSTKVQFVLKYPTHLIEIAIFIASKACCSFTLHSHSFPTFVKHHSGSAMKHMSRMNMELQVMLQRKLRRALASFGNWASLMALTRSSVGEIPLEVKRSPKKVISSL